MLRFLLLTLCCVAPLGAQSLPTWRLEARPLVVAGGANVSEAAELLHVRGAVRLPDGSLAVANGKPVTVKLYDARGRHLRNIGRAGEGPGDFPQVVEVGEWNGDTILAMSGGGVRRALFRRDGTVIREWTATSSEPRFSAQVYRRAVVRHPQGGLTECVRNVVMTTPMPPRDRFHEFMPASGGRVWIRQFGSRTWQVHEGDGRAIAQVTLPEGFDPIRITDSIVIGRAMDADDIERVEAWVVRGTSARPAACEQERASFARGEFPAERGARMRSTMRNQMTAGAGYHHRQGRYPATVAEMVEQGGSADGFDLTLLGSNGAGWAFAVTDPESGATCLAAMGTGVLVAWPDGVIVCGS